MFEIGDLVFVKDLEDEKLIVSKYNKKDGTSVYEVEGSVKAFYESDLLMISESKGTKKKDFNTPSEKTNDKGEHGYVESNEKDIHVGVEVQIDDEILKEAVTPASEETHKEKSLSQRMNEIETRVNSLESMVFHGE